MAKRKIGSGAAATRPGGESVEESLADLSPIIRSTLETLRKNAGAAPESDSPYCGKCRFGWLIENGRARRCPCSMRLGVEDRQERIDDLLKRHRAGISQKLSRVSVMTFLVRPNQEHIKPALDQYIRDLDAGKKYGFFIYGRTGVGKSYAAAYIVNSIRHLRIMPAAMINFSRTLTALRSTFRDDEEHQALVSVLHDTPLLAIDDLGMEQKVGESPDVSWSVAKFYEVIDWRMDQELPTVITSNRTIEELTERLGEAIMTRIRSLTIRLDMAPSGDTSPGWR